MPKKGTRKNRRAVDRMNGDLNAMFINKCSNNL